jgi:hypothetical protein
VPTHGDQRWPPQKDSAEIQRFFCRTWAWRPNIDSFRYNTFQTQSGAATTTTGGALTGQAEVGAEAPAKDYLFRLPDTSRTFCLDEDLAEGESSVISYLFE